MKQFLQKHQSRIIFWAIFSLIVLYLAPKQNNFYLDKDIENFKTKYFTPTLFWLWGSVCFLFLIFSLLKTRPLFNAIYSSFFFLVFVAWFLFIFQGIFLAASLFINRQFKQGHVTKIYQASYIAGVEANKNNFFLYDLTTGNISSDSKLTDRLYNSGVKQNDTITLEFERGLFGINYQSNAFKKN